jgi:hypothetical protein
MVDPVEFVEKRHGKRPREFLNGFLLFGFVVHLIPPS